MSNVLVLTRYDLSALPIPGWLAEHGHSTLLMTSDGALSGIGSTSRYRDLRQHVLEHRHIPNLFDSPDASLQAIDWADRHGVDHVVCLDERGLIAAAEIRHLLKVKSGQCVESAQAFRDKSMMLSYIASSSVRTPATISVSSLAATMGAYREIGFPAVLKPIDGMGSSDTTIIREWPELERWLRARPATFSHPYLYQQYIDGSMYSVDGYVAGSELVEPTVSRYSESTLSYKDHQPYVSLMVPSDAEEHAMLTSAAREVVAVLPDAGGTAIHAEFFLTANNEVWFCEIASRAGGGGVRQAHERVTGNNLFRTHALLQSSVTPPRPERTAELAGWFLEPKPTGTLLFAADECDLDEVFSYTLMGARGSTYDGPSSSVDAIQRFVFASFDRAALLAYPNEIRAWCDDFNVIERARSAAATKDPQ